MSGNRYLVDTNIVIYLLSGDTRIADLLDQSNVYLSFISEIELQSFKKLSPSETDLIYDFLNDVVILDINAKIKQFTVELRNSTELKIPDAIIAATAKFLNIPILTADQQFRNIERPQVILYNP